MKLEFSRIFIFLITITCLKATCLNQLTLKNLPEYNKSYCLPVIAWNISDTSLNKLNQLDTQAYNYYTQLYTVYYQNKSVDIDCLGMAKYFFCASAFPICIDDQTDSSLVCDWLCNLYQIRCSGAMDLVSDICSVNNIASQKCSFQLFHISKILPFILIFCIIFL